MGSNSAIGPEIRTELGDDGVLLATIDMPGRSMNVFSAALMDALQALLDEVQCTSAIRAVVLCSGKPTFLAGADLEMVRSFTDRAQTDSPEQLHQLCGRLGRLFRRLETNGKPFVAAIHGLALGGGLEVALACHARVAAEKTEIGLPEIKLGLLPGAGGTQRLPRLIGRRAALKLMLRGDPLPAAQAHSLGIVDAVVPFEVLLERARTLALELSELAPVRSPWDNSTWVGPVHLSSPRNDDGDVGSVFKELDISAEVRRLYPAHGAIVDCVTGGWLKPMDEAISWEMDCFVRLIQDRTAGNMIRSLFLDRQRASKLIPASPGKETARALVKGSGSAAVAKLLRAARVEILDADSPDCLVILTDDAPMERGADPDRTIRWLHGVTGDVSGPAVWVSDLTQYGRAVEVIPDEAGRGRDAGLRVARWLRATPVIAHGSPILPCLARAGKQHESANEADRLQTIALAASQARSRDPNLDTGIADSAAVIAGLFPPYAGGPFTYLRQHNNADAH